MQTLICKLPAGADASAQYYGATIAQQKGLKNQ